MSPNEPRATCHARRFRHYLMIGIAQVALSQGTPSLAAAEDAPRQSAEIKSFHIPAQPLSSALAAFGQQSGRQTSYDPAIARNVQTSGVSGAMTPEAAISSLLNGTPVQFHRLNAHTLVLERKNATNITLGPVRVGGTVAHQDPTGPSVGYVAENTMAATKTDTPLTEIPNSIFVITKQQMIDQQPQSIQDALKYTPGVYAGAQGTWNNGAAAGNVNGYSQRGFRTRQFVDGIMSESLSSGEPAFLERIEAINGPASVMYGQVTPGGMIASTLKKPTSTPLHQVSVGLGNWGRYEATADVSDKVTQSGNVRYRVAAIGVTQGTQTEHVGYHRVGVLPSLTWDIDPDTSLTVLGSYMYTPGSGVSAGNTYPLQGTLITDGYARIPRKNFLSMTNWNTNSQTDAMFEYQFQHRFNQYINLSQSFRWEKSKELDKDAYYDGYSDGTVYEAPQLSAESTRTVGLDTRLFGKFSTGPFRHTWVVGSDFRDYHYVYPWTLDEREDVAINIYTPQTSYSPCFSSVPSAKCLGDHSLARDDYFQEGVYFQDQIKWKRLSVLLGGRQDWVNYNAHSQDHYYDNTSATSVNTYSTNSTAPQPQSAFTWRAGLLYNFDFGLTPYFSYSTSFVPQQSTNWQGQPFAPLTGKQLEAGLKYKVPNKDILLTAAAYHIDEDHYLISDAVHTGYSADAGRVRSQGFELSANANITHDLRMIASYSYTDIRYANTNKSSKRFDPYTNASYGTAISQSGMTVPYVPRNMVSAFLDYSFPKAVLDGFGINGGVRYVGFTYIDNVESFKTPAYVLFDIGAHYDLGRASPVLKGLKAQLAISNLTNKYYLASCSTYQCYIGQGRRVYGNLTYSW